MSEHPHPHDCLFKKVFSNMEIVEDNLFNNIPPLAECMVPGKLKDCRESFVSSELRKYYSDLLLKAQLKEGDEAFMYILFEHKSNPDPNVAFQFNGYMLQAWERVKTKGKLLPFIFPLVIYHGKQKWLTDTNFASLVHIPKGMGDYVPHFKYYLFDLSQYSDEEIKGTILSRVFLLLLKHIKDQNFGTSFNNICQLLRELGDEKTALEYMRIILEYIGNTTDKITEEEIREGVKQALPQTGEKLMPTLFEKIEEKGRVEGRVEGLQLPLELKYGQEGLALFQQVKNRASLDIINKIEEAIRKDASIKELEQILKDYLTNLRHSG